MAAWRVRVASTASEAVPTPRGGPVPPSAPYPRGSNPSDPSTAYARRFRTGLATPYRWNPKERV